MDIFFRLFVQQRVGDVTKSMKMPSYHVNGFVATDHVCCLLVCLFVFLLSFSFNLVFFFSFSILSWFYVNNLCEFKVKVDRIGRKYLHRFVKRHGNWRTVWTTNPTTYSNLNESVPKNASITWQSRVLYTKSLYFIRLSMTDAFSPDFLLQVQFSSD